jgi:hypothetical protein
MLDPPAPLGCPSHDVQHRTGPARFRKKPHAPNPLSVHSMRPIGPDGLGQRDEGRRWRQLSPHLAQGSPAVGPTDVDDDHRNVDLRRQARRVAVRLDTVGWQSLLAKPPNVSVLRVNISTNDEYSDASLRLVAHRLFATAVGRHRRRLRLQYRIRATPCDRAVRIGRCTSSDVGMPASIRRRGRSAKLKESAHSARRTSTAASDDITPI